MFRAWLIRDGIKGYRYDVLNNINIICPAIVLWYYDYNVNNIDWKNNGVKNPSFKRNYGRFEQGVTQVNPLVPLLLDTLREA